MYICYYVECNILDNIFKIGFSNKITYRDNIDILYNNLDIIFLNKYLNNNF